MSGTILDDAGILGALTAKTVLLEIRSKVGGYEDVILPASNNMGKDSFVQASSLDMTIGRFYEPPEEPIQDAALNENVEYQTGFKLEPGHTVVVETLEKITLDNQHGAFGFPPARVSKNSILMTNPGHVDPGFSGHLQFTVINMGREPYDLRIGENIVSLIMFAFAEPVTAGYGHRYKNSRPSTALAPLLNRLAPDFANFTGRIENAVKKAVDDKSAEFSVKVIEAKHHFNIASVVIPAALGLIGIFVANYVTAQGYVADDDLTQVVERIRDLESNAGLLGALDRIESLEGQVLNLENQIEPVTDPAAQ